MHAYCILPLLLDESTTIATRQIFDHLHEARHNDKTELWSMIDSDGKLFPLVRFRMVPCGSRNAHKALPRNVLPQFAGPKKEEKSSLVWVRTNITWWTSVNYVVFSSDSPWFVLIREYNFIFHHFGFFSRIKMNHGELALIMLYLIMVRLGMKKDNIKLFRDCITCKYKYFFLPMLPFIHANNSLTNFVHVACVGNWKWSHFFKSSYELYTLMYSSVMM